MTTQPNDKLVIQQQIVDQCRAIAHIAVQIANIHAELATIYEKNIPENILMVVGKRTAGLMEQLGDIMNGMDAVDTDDAWLDPIFDRSQSMFLSRE